MRKLSLSSYLPLERSQLTADFIAGLTFAVVNVPQGMANAVLATVNPVFGLYTLMVATPVGALFTSSVFMNVSTTGALSVAVGAAMGALTGKFSDYGDVEPALGCDETTTGAGRAQFGGDCTAGAGKPGCVSIRPRSRRFRAPAGRAGHC